MSINPENIDFSNLEKQPRNSVRLFTFVPEQLLKSKTKKFYFK
jgi:hypothetical protein